MYVLTDGQAVKKYPYTLADLKRDNPHVSFPQVLTDAVLAEWGVHPVAAVNPPAFDYGSQSCLRTDPTYIGGRWVEAWEVVPATTEESAERHTEIAAQVRAQRNDLLAASDWTQLPDAQVDKQAWAAYRQDLRNITKQSGFPWAVTLPTEPK